MTSTVGQPSLGALSEIHPTQNQVISCPHLHPRLLGTGTRTTSKELEQRQDEVLEQLEALDQKLNDVLSGLGVTMEEESEAEIL